MKGGLRRFLHLERPRPGAPPARDAGAARARFGAVEISPPAPQVSSRPPASAADRFRAPQGSGLALEVASPDEQPFLRCVGCEADSPRHAAHCHHCGADLDTPEQRVFNERLWEARRREVEAEAQAEAARQQALQVEADELVQARRKMGEAMADEILQRERARVSSSWLVRLGRLLTLLDKDRYS